ncbi:rhs-associated protein [Bacillus altitudinis]|uniref:Rhs-associated protein n=1 Tax=Bacillus altitudinis TaxID=293387 RepID=A0ABV1S1V8_BACAB|nr:rhs-associated protein [Bacillus altitudinis]MBY0185860.1 rhs-associated protein [Bacillus aerophilus]MCW4359686.1 rhs-associated protein [Bacillus altitudinis]MCY7579812.1 rhs-associated protein [Bacillus altitudinis]MCY7595260.1 rhs-associated protein [Bacillus altitudinis]NOL33812.1 rhs-associated protein [Bacillus altitudinis]
MKDLELKDLLNCVKVHKYPEIYLDLIEQKFEFDASKIDWSQTNHHHSMNSNNESLLPDALLFITELKEKYLDNNLQVIYIGDNLTEFGYQFELKHIEELLVYFLDIPQHHYFISLEGDWCMCISYENYLDFGFSLNKK